ncbi:MAG: EF-Tu/IF-2/RF-3 family GTPase [Nitrososphaera sp.]|nr:EF-Tu/IF-2/RF-3 family GTPase [Nitrososphaera sp.]
MNSINFVLLGDHSIAQQLGKKGTTTDIAIYDRKTADTVYTWTAPVTFPEKIQSLMQAVNIAEYAIVNAAKLDRYLGEQIVALDFAGFAQGFIMHSYEVDRERLRTMLKTTSLSNFQFVDSVDQLKQEMTKVSPKGTEGPLVIPVDHAFDVKGVGTVALGVIKQGTVNVYDELALMPGGKTIVIKSIQMHDDPVESSHSPSRVGLAIKGAGADDITRGDVICAPDSVKVSASSLSLKFMKSVFFKGDLPENQMYMISVGMQIRPVKITKNDADILEVSLEKPITYLEGQTCVLLKPDNQGNRIVGKGRLQ